MVKFLFVSFVMLFLLSNHAIAQSCSGYPWTLLTNGSPANATDVMNNFNCVLSSPRFSGNVGVGTSSPGSNTLEIYNASAMLNVNNGSISTSLDANQLFSTGGPLYLNNSSGNNTILNATGGNVGIGTPSPTNLLQVGSSSTRGTVDIVGTAFASPATLTFSDTANIAHSYTIYQGVIYGIGLFDQNTGQWRMVWADNGNVGIGTTSPAQALEVNGQIKVDSLASASSTALCITATSNGVISNCSSSLRYKEDIHDAHFGLKEIEALRPVTFKWKGRDERDFGLIAEETAKINPLFVTYKNNKIEGVKYPQLVAVLVNAIKAQQAQIDQLKAANRELSAEVSSIKARLKIQTARR